MACTINKTRFIKGVTLIELTIYMTVFSIITTGFLNTSLYIQQIIHSRTYINKAKECVYSQFILLQQYSNFASSYNFNHESISFNTSKMKITLKLDEQGGMVLLYNDTISGSLKKTIYQCGNLRFKTINFSKSISMNTLTKITDMNISVEFADTGKRSIIISGSLVIPPVF